MKKSTIMQYLKSSLMYLLLVLIISGSYAQVAINTDGGNPDISAMLDVQSTTKGFLPPCMSASQMNAINTPPVGLMVYNTTVNSVFCFNGSSWKMLFSNDGESCGIINYGARTYGTVIIGTQCWMAENLNIGTPISGTSSQANNGTIEKYCYDNSVPYCGVYGGLYQWDEMMQYVTTEGTQGICPTGWHLPTDAEWKSMEMYLGMSQTQADAIGWRGTDEGSKLKEAGTAHWTSPNTGATNSSGFTGLPGGYRNTDGSFDFRMNDGNMWSSSMYYSSAWLRTLNYQSAQVHRGYFDKSLGYSVRCVRD